MGFSLKGAHLEVLRAGLVHPLVGNVNNSTACLPKRRRRGKRRGKERQRKMVRIILKQCTGTCNCLHCVHHTDASPDHMLIPHLGAEGGELSVEEMYKRTLHEVGSLREQLGKRCI